MRRILLKEKVKQIPVVEISIIDAAGLCRFCKNVKKDMLNKHINFISSEYKLLYCNKYKNSCYIARESIVSCEKFREKKPNFFFKLISEIINFFKGK